MSDIGALTVPAAGWYPDRNEANTVRWWDGQQWTDQTQSTAPAAAAFEQPVSSSAFGFVAPEQNPVAPSTPVAQVPVVQTTQISPGWYPDHSDPALQRWWDGRGWTAHTTPTVVIPVQTAGGYPGSYPTPIAPTVNSMATRGMLYSLIGLVLNPFAMMSIGGFVLGIRALRRAPQFPDSTARRGPAIAAIVLGAIGTVLTTLLIIAAIATAISGTQRAGVHVFDQEGAQRQLLSQLTSAEPTIPAVSVSCPADPAMKPGDTFDCTATLSDGSTLPVHITIYVQNGVYLYNSTANYLGGSVDPEDDSAYEVNHPGIGTPFTLPVIEQTTSADISSHYAVSVVKITCDSDASVAAGDFFTCVLELGDRRTVGVQITMSDQPNNGYDLLVTYPPAGGNPTAAPSAPPGDSDPTDPDLSHS